MKFRDDCPPPDEELMRSHASEFRRLLYNVCPGCFSEMPLVDGGETEDGSLRFYHDSRGFMPPGYEGVTTMRCRLTQVWTSLAVRGIAPEIIK